MLNRVVMAVLTATLCVVLVSGVAQACRRQYLATYGYYTPEKGELEIEQYTDSYVSQDGDTTLQSKTELEYGITDRLMTAIYLVNKKPDGGSFDYAETKLQVRYRLNEPGRHFWDTAGYLEFVRPNDSEEPYEMEMKGIFSHEFPMFNLSCNIIGEKKLRGGEEIVLGYAVGIAPHMTGRTKYSFEVYGKEGKHYIMPAVWLSPGKRQSIGIGIAKGLTGSSDDIQVRTLYAMEF
ncbi:MAG: hypothetical protein ACYC0V_20305 [Armatimonadota bacterium]